MQKVIKAVIYARFSSDMQRTESIDAQVRACTAACRERGYTIVRTYADEARSGKNDKREQFQQMIADSEQGKFDICYIHKMDRFSRDPYDTLYYSKILKRNHVQLLSVTESFSGGDTPEDEMMRLVNMGMNRYFVLNLARETKKGQMENALKCLTTGGKGALGYDVKDKHFVINEREAEAVRVIFTMYDEGNGYMTIIHRLNLLGYKTKRGQVFAKNSLYEILRNPKYCGTYVYNRSRGADEYGTRSPHTHKALDQQVVIEDGVPAIVSKELWQRVQERMDSNKRAGGSFKAKKQYLLTGLIRCGLCGGSYHGNCRKPAKDRPDFVTYRCSNRDVKGSRYCQNREIQKDEVEELVLEQIERYFCSDALIPTLTRNLNEYLKRDTQSADTEKSQLENRLADLEKQSQNIIEAVAQSGISELFTDKLHQIKDEIATLKETLSSLKYQVNDIEITEQMVRDYFSGFWNYAKLGNPAKLKQMVQAYVKSVEIFPDSLTITFQMVLPLGEQAGTPMEYTFAETYSREPRKAG